MQPPSPPQACSASPLPWGPCPHPVRSTPPLPYQHHHTPGHYHESVAPQALCLQCCSDVAHDLIQQGDHGAVLAAAPEVSRRAGNRTECKTCEHACAGRRRATDNMRQQEAPHPTPPHPTYREVSTQALHRLGMCHKHGTCQEKCKGSGPGTRFRRRRS